MSKHSVSEAARLAGVSRSYFYKKYIKSGLIAVERDKDGKPIIDTTEIMRACGDLKSENNEFTENVQFNTLEIQNKNTALQIEIQLLREQLTASIDREKWYQEQLVNANRLLEHRPAEQPKGLLKRLFGW